jgi:hypothetical protein
MEMFWRRCAGAGLLRCRKARVQDGSARSKDAVFSLAIRPSEPGPIIVHGSYGCWAVQSQGLQVGALGWCRTMTDACSIVFHGYKIDLVSYTFRIAVVPWYSSEPVPNG